MRIAKPITITLSAVETLLVLGALRTSINNNLASEVDKNIAEKLIDRIAKELTED